MIIIITIMIMKSLIIIIIIIITVIIKAYTQTDTRLFSIHLVYGSILRNF